MSRRFQFTLGRLMLDTGLLCSSLGVLTWTHSMSGCWNSPGDDWAVVFLGGIAAVIVAVPLRHWSLWPLNVFRSWCLFVAVIALVLWGSYHFLG
jgi:hypothetical protein